MPLWYSGYQNARKTWLCQPTHQARFVQRVDNALRIYPVDNAIIGSLSNSVFERRTSTGSCFFAPLRRDFEQIFGQIVSIRVKTLSNTNLVGPRHIKREKRLLPVDVRRSKTSLLKLPIFPNSYLLDSDLSGSLHNRRNTYFLRFSGERGQEWKGRGASDTPCACLRSPEKRVKRLICRLFCPVDSAIRRPGRHIRFNICRFLARIVTVTWFHPG